MSVVAVVFEVGNVVDPGADVDVGGDVAVAVDGAEGAAQAPRKTIMKTSANNVVLGFMRGLTSIYISLKVYSSFTYRASLSPFPNGVYKRGADPSSK